MTIRLIENESQLKAAFARLEELFDAPKGTDEGEEAEILSILIQDYERRTIPDAELDPVQVIQFVMEQRGFTYTDLARVIGSPARASDIMNRRRRLTVQMIRRLHTEFGIPSDLLIGEIQLTTSPKLKSGRRKSA